MTDYRGYSYIFMANRCRYFLALIFLICDTYHVTSVLSMMTATFQVVTSPSGGSEWCSVDQPSAVIQMARGDMAQTCAMECLKNGCCMMCQFKVNSFLCELFEYTSANFSAIPSCSSQRITMRNGQPPVTQRSLATMQSPMYVTDRSNNLCLVPRPSYYIVSFMNNKTIDIGGGGGNPGDPIVMMPLQIGKTSQRWYFDSQGYIRSAVNEYGVEMVNSNYGCPGGSYQELGVKPFNGNSNQQWVILNSTSGNIRIVNNNIGKNFNICGRSSADGTGIIQFTFDGGLNNFWSLIVQA